MATWPATLPPTQFRGVARKPQDPVLRTQTDSGPVKTRLKYTAVPIRVTTRTIFSGTQLLAFMTWFENDLAFGALSFDWTDPMDGTTVAFRFTEPPEFVNLRPAPIPANRLWEGQLSLEIMP